jgi:twitching motility protein PilT
VPFDLDAALAEMLELGASDLHLKVPSPPRVRIEGELLELGGWAPLTPDDTDDVRAAVLRSEVKRRDFEQRGSADVSYWTEDGRFRVAAYSQRGSAAFVFRAIPEAPVSEGLGLPRVVLDWANAMRGLVVVSGPTGQGKSTTIAVLVRLINERRPCHIVTIEDPIEFLHRDDHALISQREIGHDAPDPHEALRAALRQDPDVIMIGEVRDPDTAMTALRAAETGHLVLCTMHTPDASETVQRFVDLFGEHAAGLARQMLSATLLGVVSQRLVPGADGRRKLNTEVLVNSSRVRDLIGNGTVNGELRDAMTSGDFYGMHTFHQSLVELVRTGEVDRGDALAFASNAHDFKLALAELEAA